MKLSKIYIAAIATALLTACSDDNNKYVPADFDDPDCMGVYFDMDNGTDYLFMPGADATLKVKMHRQRTEAAADVPLIFTCSADGVSCPETVHFDAGSADAVVEIDCSAVPPKMPVKLNIDLPDEYTNHYTETLFNYQATVLFSQWESANTDGSPVKVWFTTTDYNYYTNPKPEKAVFEPIECPMDVLPGTGIVRLGNFLGAGFDLQLRLSESPYGDFVGKYRVSPVTHHYSLAEAYEDSSYGDEWYNAWYLVQPEDVDAIGDDDEIADEDFWLTLNLTTLEGTTAQITYPMFFWYSDSYAYEYAYAVLKDSARKVNSISMGFSGVCDDTSVTIPGYFYIFFSWDGQSGL